MAAKNKSKSYTKKSQILAKTTHSSKKKPNNKLLFLIAGVIVIAGIWLIAGGEEKDNYDKLGLPSYAYNNAITLKAYGYTVQNPLVVEKIPCYCGCGGMGHKSLKNCFISDDGIYSSHASNCDICVGEVIKVKNLFESGMYISDVRARIDSEYKRYGPDNGGVPITVDFNINTLDTISSNPRPAPVEKIDYSKLELSPNFRSLSDSLKITPKGVIWGQFINMKQVSGTPLEDYASQRVQPVGFYGVPLVAMYSADYSQNSWIEMHDIGFSNDLSIKPVSEAGMSNIIASRPFIFGHTINVQQTLQLRENPSSMENAFADFESVLKGIDGENTAMATVSLNPNQYADIFYSGMNDAGNGLVQRELVYHLLPGGEALADQYQNMAADSLARGFTRYEVDQSGDLLKVIITGTLDNVLNEAL